MKTITIFLITCFCIIKVNGQSFNDLKSLNANRYACACYDNQGRLYAGYPSLDNDSIYFDRYDYSNKQWSYKVRSALTHYEWDEFNTNVYSCASIGDSLYVNVYRDYSGANNRTYIIDDVGGTKIADYHKVSEFNTQSEFQAHGNRLHFIGDCDSINNNDLGYHAYWENGVWKSSNSPIGKKTSTQGGLGFSIAGDSGIFISKNGNNSIYNVWTYPNNWDTLQLNNNFVKVFRINGSFVFAKEYITDSLFYLNGSTLIGRKLNKAIDCEIAVETDSGVFFFNHQNKWFNPQYEILYFYKPNTGDVELVYQIDKYFRIEMATNGGKAAFISNTNILYNNSNLNRVADVNLSNIKSFSFDTVVVNVFLDKNNDGILNGNDEYPLSVEIRNVRSNKKFKQQLNGTFIERLINYNDVEYELIDFEFYNCASRRYTYQKRAMLTNSNQTKYELNFPIQESNQYKNVSVRGKGLTQARLNDTTDVLFNVFNTECDSINKISSKVELVLANGSSFVSSVPAHSYRKGDTIGYSNYKIPGRGKSEIKFRVVYPNSVFSINDKVKHQLYFIDTTDNFNDDNKDSVVQVLVYSYDPNIKSSTPQGKVMHAVDRIRYHIQFQNEGNDVARKVRVIDSLDSRFNIYDLNVLETSHPYSFVLDNGVAEFTFGNINLIPKNISEEESRGYIVFDIRLKKPLNENEKINNKAYIYFDDNTPIITPSTLVERIPYKWTPLPLDLKADFNTQIDCRELNNENRSKGAFKYKWYFGDGTESDLQEPEHIYYRKGKYIVQLIATGYDSINNKEKSDSISKEVIVSCDVCEVQNSYTYIIDSINCKKIYFNNEIQGDSINVVWKYNTIVINQNNPVHIFANKGKYIVTRYSNYYNTVYNNTCKDTFSKEIEIVCDPNGLENLKDNRQIEVQTNPFQKELVVINRYSEQIRFRIYDSNGRIIEENILENGTNKVNSELWESGIYILLIEGKYWIKLVKAP